MENGGQTDGGSNRKGLANITEQQHKMTNFRTGLGDSAQLGQGERMDRIHSGNGQSLEG